MFFSIFTELCNHHHNLILEHVPFPEKTCPSPSPTSTHVTTNFSVSIDYLINFYCCIILPCLYHSLFTHSPTDGHLGCFPGFHCYEQRWSEQPCICPVLRMHVQDVFFGIYIIVDLQDHEYASAQVKKIIKTIWKLYSQVVVQLHTLTSNKKERLWITISLKFYKVKQLKRLLAICVALL